MRLSVVIPARNEEKSIETTIRDLHATLSQENIDHEIVVVNDNSKDGTELILSNLEREISTLRSVNNGPPGGFGLAIGLGLERCTGEAVATYMADGSDRPEDLARFFAVLREKNVDCVFGTRFSTSSRVIDYPIPKLILNRLGNKLIQILFGLRYNDVTNAFKLYRREVIQGLLPLLSHHYNMTVELPLKAIIRGYSYVVLPNDWTNRKLGQSKLKIDEMGSRYIFIILYCFLEKLLSRGDYRKGKTRNSS